MKITECPRDAMQGLEKFVPTQDKISYLNALLEVGFDTLDFGSFVSPKAIPQMADTAEVLAGLKWEGTQTKLLAIIANLRGAETACSHAEISYLGYPFSISETFQKRNTNCSMQESLDRVKEIQDLCVTKKKELVIYISMAFGNPYGDPWSANVAVDWVGKLGELGIRIFSMSDTVGVSGKNSITTIFQNTITQFPNYDIGAHLHTTPDTWREKMEAAYASGCRRFDGAIKGFGGCPMAEDRLTGNMPTENIIQLADEKNEKLPINREAFQKALIEAAKIFG
jgi:hydroxymethylglutaryl-CoA lyase